MESNKAAYEERMKKTIAALHDEFNATPYGQGLPRPSRQGSRRLLWAEDTTLSGRHDFRSRSPPHCHSAMGPLSFQRNRKGHPQIRSRSQPLERWEGAQNRHPSPDRTEEERARQDSTEYRGAGAYRHQKYPTRRLRRAQKANRAPAVWPKMLSKRRRPNSKS